ncbi:hypothetical protein EDC04DRAFT_2908828 [Pisolithus marmoratus]|nr:hypothetical protein EDC04DRAFT_2908828 [Pisolithus marmoratus]
MPRRVKTSSVPWNVKAFDTLSLKEDFHSELHTSIFDEGMLLSTKYNGDIIADCWFPDKILLVVPNAELLIMLMGPDGKLLYDLSEKQWNVSYLPPIMHGKLLGLQEHPERLPPAEEERELSTFMTAVMDALIIYYKSTPHSALQGTEASFPNDLTPDPHSFALHTNDVASAPTTFTPMTSILNTSPLLQSSSGSHSDPGEPTVPQGNLKRLILSGSYKTSVQIKCKALAMFDAQPNRAFSYSLTFCNGQYCLYMYDHAGGILCVATFAPTSWLGIDDMFNCQLHPVITCFSSCVIWGHATHVWFVSPSVPPSDPNDIFIIKDFWVNEEHKLLEEQILKELNYHNIECVLKVVKACTVQQDGQEDLTSLHCPKAFMSHFNWHYDHHVHQWLILTPARHLITHAESPLEVITCVLDLIITHKKIWALKILHQHISINNAMMYKEALPDGTVKVWGLLINFDYIVKVDGSSHTAGPADCMGMLPFMAIELLQAGEDSSIQYTAAHNVKSFVYLLC